MSQLEDRKMLKEMFHYVFEEMIDYTDYVYDAIHQRVFDEFYMDTEHKNIYVTMMPKSEYDEIDPFMFPMIAADLEPWEISVEQWNQSIQQGEEIILGTTYLAADYLELQTLDLNRDYEATLYTDCKHYSIKVKLKQSGKYIKKVEQMYQYFRQNNMEWITVNAPYLYKYYDFILSAPIEIEGESVNRVSVSLGELDSIRKEDCIPFWNLEETGLLSANFPIATGDSLRFQHMFELNEGESPFEYIVQFEKDHDGYVIRDPHTISIVITEESISKWPVYHIHEPENGWKMEYPYSVYSNKSIDSFMVGFVKRQRRTIRSKAELIRLLQSYEASSMLEIKGVEIRDISEEKKETYVINYFIEDDIRTDCKRKQLLVVASAKQETYFARDILSFLLGELQCYFPEYECVGTILNAESSEKMLVD